mgnify:CR=1 FL=1
MDGKTPCIKKKFNPMLSSREDIVVDGAGIGFILPLFRKTQYQIHRNFRWARSSIIAKVFKHSALILQLFVQI